VNFSMAKKNKAEHSGTRNGGYHCGTREEAKTTSKSLRRSKDKEVVKEQLEGLENDEEVNKPVTKEAQALVEKGIEAAKLRRFTVIDLEDSIWVDVNEES